MKNHKLLLVGFILLNWASMAQAQIPYEINYQAVVRDTIAVYANDSVIFRFSVFNSSILEYQETQHLKTNDLGMIRTTIGGSNGTVTTGSMQTISWGGGNLNLLVEVKRGQGFDTLGTSKIVAVPLALFADKSSKAVNMTLNDLNDVSIGSLAKQSDFEI